MKNHQIFLCTLLLSLCLFSVEAQVIEVDIRNVLEVDCPSDSSVKILKYQNWEIYQTVDNSVDGPRRNDICPTLLNASTSPNFVRYEIDLASIDPNSILYIATEEDLIPLTLEKNRVSTLSAGFQISDTWIKFGIDSTGDIQSGLYLFTEHYDPAYADTLFCNINYDAGFNTGMNVQTCFAAQKTASNDIAKAIYKVSFDGEPSGTLRPYSIWADNWGSQNSAITDPVILVEEQYYSGSSYDLPFGDLVGSYENALIVHHEDGLPAQDNQSITEITPVVNKPEPTPINIDLDYTSLNYQKYTQLTGGLVEGSDSLRHPLNIIMNNEFMCLFLIDAIGGGGTSFMITNNGGIHFEDTEACLQIRDNSSLIIDQGVSTKLGNAGVGNVNLRSGGKILLRENSELVFDGRMILTPYWPYTGEENIHIDLQPGSHLHFTDRARIDNNLFGDELFLYIHMNGGTLNTSLLSQEDQQKIILVFPEHIYENNNPISIFPNPVAEQLTILHQEQNINSVQLYNTSGQKIFATYLHSPSSMYQLDVDRLAPGLYVLLTEVNGQVLTNKVQIE